LERLRDDDDHGDLAGVELQDRKRAAVARANVVPASFDALDLDAEPQELSNAVVHIFTLNGQEFYAPKEPSAGISLEYMQMARTLGAVAAQGWLLEQLLGTDGYEALMRWPGLTARHLAVVIGILEKIATDASGDNRRPLGRG
jgi:hypothetical protein